MATLYVENVPRELYEALRGRARQQRRSIAAEVLALLEESIPTEKELKARRELVRQLGRMRRKKSGARSSFPTAEEMQREDRAR